MAHCCPFLRSIGKLQIKSILTIVKDTAGFFSTLQETGSNTTPGIDFTSDIFHGASFDLHNGTAEAVAALEALPEVEKVWPADVLTIPKSEMDSVRTFSSVNEGLPPWSPHNDTNVARVHAEGHLGEGAIVAIVDSGIDYNHPALGGGFGTGFKIDGGYDFVGDGYQLGDEYSPDDDPQDCLGHGTHVAGIVASENEIVPGVAPAARLRAYKVFGCGDSTMEDVIMAAFIRAYEDGADIINASLGSSRGFPDAPLAAVASAIQALGVFVSVAAGNSGDRGT